MNKPLGIGIAAGLVIGAAGALYYITRDPTPVGPPDNWTHVVDSDSGDQVYVDLNTVRYIDGQIARAWVMISRAKPTEDGARTSMAITLYDCAEDKFKILTGHVTDRPYGRGKHTGEIGEGAVKDVVPGSVSADVLTLICQPLIDQAQKQLDTQPHNNAPRVNEQKDI